MRLGLAFFFSLLLVQSHAQINSDGWFQVDDVPRATKKLGVLPAEQVIEARVGHRVMVVSENLAKKKLVLRPNNAFIQTIHEAFDKHRPLSLGPEDFLMLMALGASQHIQTNFEALKPQLYIHPESAVITVRNDSLNTKPEPWAALVAGLRDKALSNSKWDVVNLFTPDFTTDTPDLITALNIVYLESNKKIYTYVGETGCGIPSIQLRGTAQDWEKLLSRLSTLDALGMQWWTKELRRILEQCIQARMGKIDPLFWQSIYKREIEYGEEVITGWVVELFPYLERTTAVAAEKNIVERDSMMEMGYEKLQIEWYRNPYLSGETCKAIGPSSDDFPGGLAKVDLLWNNYKSHTARKMELCSGFMGTAQADDLSLSVAIGWCVADRMKPPRYDWSRPHEDGEKLAHRMPKESVLFSEQVSNTAYFTFDGMQGNNNDALRNELRRRLIEAGFISGKNAMDYIVEVEVLVNKTVGTVRLFNTKTQKEIEAKETLQRMLEGLNGQWTCATITQEKFFNDTYNNFADIESPQGLLDYEPKALMKVNSRLMLKL